MQILIFGFLWKRDTQTKTQTEMPEGTEARSLAEQATVARQAEVVQTDYAGLTAAGTGDKIDSQVTAYIETLRKQPIPEGVTYGAED